MTDTRADAAADPYLVLVNHEEQYSIWRADQVVPDGWDVVGDPAPKAACLERIDELWTDMRPASLRRAMDGAVGAEKSDVGR